MADRIVTLQECDNPECDYSQVLLENDDEGGTGYHFGVKTGRGKDAYVASGYWVLAGGGPIPAFYAHAKKCILPAMEAAFERERLEGY